MANMVELLELIIGTPQNDIESIVLFFIAGVLTAMLIIYFLYIFKLIAGIISPRRQ